MNNIPLNVMQNLLGQGTLLPEPVLLLIVGSIMLTLGNLQRRLARATVPVRKR